MFLDNKYSKLYFKIINKAAGASRVKKTGDKNQYHHIIPRSLGGTDGSQNIVLLSYKEHKLCHRLLIKMTEGKLKYKMMYAYKLFDGDHPVPSPHNLGYYTKESASKMVASRKKNNSYKTGKDNNFAKPELIKLVKERMKANNPMKDDKQRERMRNKNNNPNVRRVQINGIIFPSIAAAARHFNTTPHLIKRDYNIQRLVNS